MGSIAIELEGLKEDRARGGRGVELVAVFEWVKGLTVRTGLEHGANGEEFRGGVSVKEPMVDHLIDNKDPLAESEGDTAIEQAVKLPEVV